MDTILFKLAANLHEVSVKFSDDAKDIGFCAIKGVKTDVVLKKKYTEVTVNLKEIIVMDLNTESVHREVSKVLYLFNITCHI